MSSNGVSLSQEQVNTLKIRALKARDLSYSPYSKFRVGCTVLTASGEYYDGANIENASYGGCICAERTTICSAILKGHRTFTAIAISSDMKDDFITPCGICRQFIREFSEDVPVFMFKGDGSYIVRTIEELLPLSFGPHHLS